LLKKRPDSNLSLLLCGTIIIMNETTSDNRTNLPAGMLTPGLPPDASEVLRRAAAEVMAIQDVTLGDARSPIRIRGRLTMDSEAAFKRLRPLFEAVGYTPLFRREDGLDVIRALPVVYGREKRRTPWAAIILLLATIVSVFYVGVQGELYVPFLDALLYRLTGATLTNPPADLLPTAAQFSSAVTTGVLYTLALLGILGAHEMGHYIVARLNKVQTTLPFFIPLPFNILGTLGAVIAMREPAPNRKVQFDIGIAGPLAGLIVAVPVMVVGLLLSQVGTIESGLADLPPSLRSAEGAAVTIFHEGNSIAYLAIKYLVFGRVLPSGNLDVWIHPVAFAAWAGFLVTALNLLPIGQLDGGHVLYGLFGEKARLARLPVIAALVVLGTAGSLSELGVLGLNFGWSGWWVWVIFAMVLLRNHAPVLDEITALDSRRKALGVLMLIVFILIFMPTPLVVETIPLAH